MPMLTLIHNNFKIVLRPKEKLIKVDLAGRGGMDMLSLLVLDYLADTTNHSRATEAI